MVASVSAPVAPVYTPAAQTAQALVVKPPAPVVTVSKTAGVGTVAKVGTGQLLSVKI